MMNGSYLAWADAPQTIEAIGYYSGDNQVTLTGAGEATRIPVSRVTPSTIAAARRASGPRANLRSERRPQPTTGHRWR